MSRGTDRISIAVVLGSVIGAIIVSLFYRDIGIKDAIAIGSGVGYYSVASLYIAKLRTNLVGTEAFLVNLFREIFTLLFSPLLVRFFGKESSIASGGATSMDTTLPIIIRSAGNNYMVPAIVSGTVLIILVPFLIALVYI